MKRANVVRFNAIMCAILRVIPRRADAEGPHTETRALPRLETFHHPTAWQAAGLREGTNCSCEVPRSPRRPRDDQNSRCCHRHLAIPFCFHHETTSTYLHGTSHSARPLSQQ